MHSFLTFIIPVDIAKRQAVERELNALDNPTSKTLRLAFKGSQIVHFMSSALVYGEDNRRDYLVIEMSVDGIADKAIAIFDDETTGLSQAFTDLFLAAGLSSKKSDTLKRHRIKTGVGYLNNPGISFSGSPGMTVKRIRREYKLARHIRDYFDQKNISGDALDIVKELRRAVKDDPNFNSPDDPSEEALSDLLSIEPTVLLNGEQRKATSPGVIFNIAAVTVGKLMWPALILAAVLTYFMLPSLTGGALIWAFFWRYALSALALLLLSTVIFAIALLRRESREHGDLSLPDMGVLNAARSREDQNSIVQNHLFGVSRMKPGLLRKISLRLAFLIIGQLAKISFRPGYLADIGTIHFARWFMIPGTDKLIFCSNYGGSWESYLEDFINKATEGLTGIWSNTFGFPPSRLLFFKGASSGEAFKRWARRQQIPTRFWYSAYPNLTTERIRINASIRKGLASAATEDEAKSFITLFASMQRPKSDVERDEIQTLMFGGLGKHEQSACILLRLPDVPENAKAWLERRIDQIGFGGAPDAKRLDQISFSATGFSKLNLHQSTIDQFSFPFLQGMSHEGRRRVLADTGEDDPKHWGWGGGKTVDAAYFIYMASDKTLGQAKQISDLKTRLNRQVKAFTKELSALGGDIVDVIITTHLNERKNLAKTEAESKCPIANSDFPREPFGFVDGVSQPLIKGLQRGTAKAGSNLHLSEAGEFILGYPDNRGTETLLPTLPASKDPLNLLPVYQPDQGTGNLPNFAKSGVNADRAFGRNGSYIVIRQLAQDVKAFDDFIDKAAKKYKSHKGIPAGYEHYQIKEFLAAKMVGRWKDGTSLVKYPYKPGTGWHGKTPNRSPDNDFLLGQEDPTGISCPYGSHIRRSNPRDSFAPHDQAQLDIVNRHRILRRGRFYKDKAGKTDTGLLFVCFNADIERQFEFIQQTWCQAKQFMGLDNEVDPILGRGRKMGRVTIPTPEGPIFLKGSLDAVTVVGGEYFFMPSKSALTYLAQVI